MIEDELRILTVESGNDITMKQHEMIAERFNSMVGIKLRSCSRRTIKIEYFAHLFSEQAVREELSSLGITFKKKRKGNLFERLLNSITKDNVKAFGGKRIDCCDLNP